MTFVEYVQQASIEKVHSQILAWLFSSECKAVDDVEQLFLLGRMVGLEQQMDDNILNIYTELEGIDVLIECRKSIVVIENKIKTSQHSNQLVRYKNYVTKEYQSKRLHFILLSLIGEVPESEGWQIFKYKDLLDGLEKCKLKEVCQKFILEDYIKTLRNLVGAVEAFINAPNEMPNVFCDGWKSKHKKSESDKWTSYQAYISKNNLETIFQKLYYNKILDELKTDFEQSKIGETRGNALLDLKSPVDFKTLTLDGQEFHFGVQFQGGTVKIQIEPGFGTDGKPRPSTKRMIAVIKKEGDAIKQHVFSSFPSQKWRYNTSHNGMSAYLSLSRKVVFADGNPFYSHRIEEVCSVFKSEVKNTIEIIRSIDHLFKR